MKKELLVLLFVCAGLISSYAQNLIPNGDMSQWPANDTTATGYDPVPLNYALGGNGSHASAYAAFPGGYNGQNALKMFYDNNQATSTRYFGTPYTSELEAGTYILTFYLKGKGWLRSVALLTSNGTLGTASQTVNSYVQQPLGGTTGASGRNVTTIPDWTKYELLYTIPAGVYRLSVSCNNGATNGIVDTLCIAGISLVKQKEEALKSLKLKTNTYSNSSRGPETVPQFDSEKLDYTIELSFNHPVSDIPRVDTATTLASSPQSTVSIEQQATSFTAPDNKAIVKVTTQSAVSQYYIVTFVQSQDFISGFPRASKDVSSKGGFESMSSSSFTNASTSGTEGVGTYWGEGIFRTSTSNALTDLITPVLSNGAGTLSFTMNKYIETPATDTDSASLHVYYNENAGDWIEIDSIGPSELTSDWKSKSCTINKNAENNVRVKLTVKKWGGSQTRIFRLDDLRITAYNTTNIKEIIPDNNIRISVLSKSILIESVERLPYRICTVSGLSVASGISSGKNGIFIGTPGVYIVQAGAQVQKIIVR